MRYLSLAFLIVTLAIGRAATNQLTSADRDTVNNAITAAVNGDVIRLPLNGSSTWTSSLSFSKAITLDFNGCTITRNIPALNGPMISVTTAAGLTTHITGGTFNGGKTGYNSATMYEPRYMAITAKNGGNARLSNCVFFPSGVQSLGVNHTLGQLLIDRCTFYSDDPDEIIHFNGHGQGNMTGWNNDVIAGDPAYQGVSYAEDNTFEWQGAGVPQANAAMQMYYGAQVVFRRNTVINALIDCHGDRTQHSGRWWEFYQNHFWVDRDSSQVMQLRGGSGVVFDNVLHKEVGSVANRYVIKAYTETGGLTNPDPSACQIGRGKNTTLPNTNPNHLGTNQASVPAHIWNNTVQTEPGAPGGGFNFSPEQVSGQGQDGPLPQTPRDYLLTNKIALGTYTPAPYPHPLAGPAPPAAVLPPDISPATGSYYGAQTISMTQPTVGASYYYTTNGSAPTSSSTLYTGSFQLPASGIVRAIGIKAGSTSSGIIDRTYELGPWTVTGAGVFDTLPVPPQTTQFTATFRVRQTSSLADAVVGLGPDPITGNGNLAANLLFNVNGTVQVRSGVNYLPNPGTYPYLKDINYDVSMVINPATQSINSVSITPEGGPTTIIGTGLTFRDGHTGTTNLDNFGFRTNAGTMTVSNLVLTPAAPVPDTYFVDKDNLSASDVPGNGSESNPWATIAYALSQIDGGDTILVKDSPTAYTIPGTTLVITGDSGTPTKYTELKAYPGHTPSIVGSGNTGRIAFGTLPPAAPVETSYWRIEGFEISNFNHCISIRNGAHHIDVLNNNLHDSGNQILHAYYDVHDIVIENNTFTEGGSLVGGANNGEAMYIGSHLGVFNSDPAFPDDTHTVTIRNNIINGMEHEGIDIKHDVLNVLIEGNLISNCVENYDYGKWSILVNPMIRYGTGSNPNHIIRDNVISRQGAAGSGAALGLATGVKAYNNIVYDVQGTAFALEFISDATDVYTRYAWANTFDTTPAQAIKSPAGGPASTGNNIGPTTAGNIAFNSSFFVNSTGRDYHLVAGTAAINSGNPNPPFAITEDADGVQRGNPPDMGAFELVTTVADTLAPTPNPATFSMAPIAIGSASITMIATEGSEPTSPPVEYFFNETTGNPGGTDSGWQQQPTYVDVGLTPATQYTYTVTMRDALLNLTGPSNGHSAITSPPPEPGRVDASAVDVHTVISR